MRPDLADKKYYTTDEEEKMEEAHYFFTIQDVVALILKHGSTRVQDDIDDEFNRQTRAMLLKNADKR